METKKRKAFYLSDDVIKLLKQVAFNQDRKQSVIVEDILREQLTKILNDKNK